MVTTDKLLIELYNSGIEKLDSKIPARDKKILSSLARQIISGHFLTENQAKLLVKILKENSSHLKISLNDKISLVDTPCWSEPFRVIEQLRKIYIKKGEEPIILVEFTYNKKVRQTVLDLNKEIEGMISSINTKQYGIPLTEKNVYTVIKALKPYGFNIDQNLMEFFHEISEILENQENPFDILNTADEKISTAVEKDVGKISEENILLLNDRKFRYQYHIFPKIAEESLTVSIAQRTSTKLWIDSKTTSLEKVIQSLIELDRLPLLFVFNGHEPAESVENLKKMADSLSENRITDNIGIYFRFDNSNDSCKIFNNQISMLKYNSRLEKDTKIVGISNNKLPKFMLTSPWRPSSVISFSNNFKNNKTSLYCDDVDLIIFYNDRQPLGDINVIV